MSGAWTNPVAPTAAPDEGPLPLAISGLFLEFPHSGTGRYARQVTASLCRDSRFQASVVVNDRALARSALEGTRTRPPLISAPRLQLRRGSYGRKLFWEQVGLPAAAARLGARVLYSPHFSTPLLASCPTVVSIHDVIPLTDPVYGANVPWQAYFRLVSMAARRAEAAITLSAHAKGEIVRVLGLEPDRVHVVSPGVEQIFHPRTSDAALANARARYALPEEYMLYLGGADARKNIGVLLQALAGIGESAPVPTVVIVARQPKAGQEVLMPDWRARAAVLGVEGRVLFVERIEEEDLPAVYAGATAFLFPSRAEGFGLTPLEAMACGTPVLCSKATSLPEATGTAAILLDPDDAAAWSEAMRRVSLDAELRSHMRGAGLERAAHFPWSATGSRVAEIILEAARCAS
jgi:glycosyltransferase involved in cell wall biosynthesis